VTLKWPMVKLSEICDLTMGRTPSRSDRSLWDPNKLSSNVWVSISDMPLSPMSRIADSKEYISDLAATKFPVVPKGTLMMSFKLSVGRTAIAEIDLRTNEAIMAFRKLDSVRINLNFLGYYLSFFNWSFHMQGDEKLLGATMNKAKLQNMEVPLPPLDEQKRIVAKLDEALGNLDQVAQNSKSALNQIDSLWGSYLESMFSQNPESTLSHAASFGRMGEALTLGELTRNTRPICYGVLKPGPNVDSGVPLIKIQDLDAMTVRTNKIQLISNELDQEFARSKLIGGEILLSIQGTIGRVAICPDDLAGANISRTLALISPDSRMDTKYLAYYLAYLGIAKLFKAGGTTRDSLNISDIREISIFVPPLDEQKQIVSKLDDLKLQINSFRTAKQGRIEEANSLRSSILSSAFAGDF
jgi:type I restriction enzyme S subunit